MEYVEGVPLTEYCARRGAPLADRLRLFRAVCEAVQAAHGQAVVHRDLKPSNILVTAEGEPKLLDFGIAKQLEELDVPAQQTETALRLMTPAYAAPEQMLGEPVGHVHGHLRARRDPVRAARGPPPLRPVAAHAGPGGGDDPRRRPARPSEAVRGEEATRRALGPRGPRRRWADLDVICLTAMHKEPSRRYRTVDALVRDVDHFLRGSRCEARPDSVGYRVRKLVRRRWSPLSARRRPRVWRSWASWRSTRCASPARATRRWRRRPARSGSSASRSASSRGATRRPGRRTACTW